MTSRTVLLAATLATALQGAAPLRSQDTWTDPAAAAAEDPDFRLQGEYAQDGAGLQVIALGDGRFQVVRIQGGLPGIGGAGDTRQVEELSREQVRAQLGIGLQRVERRSTTLATPAPEGAVVLFDGSEASLAKWQDGATRTADGLLCQGVTSRQTFGSARIHVEFRLPYKPKARGQGRGNSGLYVQGRYETQMLDSFGLEGRQNECGGIYSVRRPDVNACLPPLVWQTYDIDFLAAEFDQDGNKTAPARMTVWLNGVLIHDDVEVPKSTTASPRTEGPEPGPIFLQDHNNPVRFRNIWVLRR